MNEIERDVIEWYEYQAKNQSGNLGYPKGVNLEPGIITNPKSDPTPNSTMPSELIFIDSTMMDMPAIYRNIIFIKLMTTMEDHERASHLHVSIAKYYTLCREAMAYLKGAYATRYTGRRLNKHPAGIPL